MKIIQIMLRAFLTFVPTSRTSIGKKFTSRWGSNIEAIPVGAMDGDDAPLPLSKSERKRNRIGMVLAPIERQRHLAGSQIHDLTIAAIVIDNRDEVPIAGGMQSPPQDMAHPGFVIRLRRDINGSKMNPITSVGIPSPAFITQFSSFLPGSSLTY
jgi:hypothetical protein